MQFFVSSDFLLWDKERLALEFEEKAKKKLQVGDGKTTISRVPIFKHQKIPSSLVGELGRKINYRLNQWKYHHKHGNNILL